MQEILNRPAKLLTQAQREAYFADGFVGVEGLVDARWLERLNKVTYCAITRNSYNEPSLKNILSKGHNTDHPETKPGE